VFRPGIWSVGLTANLAGSSVPEFADGFVGGEATESLESSSEVIGRDEVGQVRFHLFLGVVEEAFDGGFFGGAVFLRWESGPRMILESLLHTQSVVHVRRRFCNFARKVPGEGERNQMAMFGQGQPFIYGVPSAWYISKGDMQTPSTPRNEDLTVSAAVGRLRAAVGEAWQDSSGDGLQCGDANAPVTGVAVAWSPGISVLQRAAAQGCNLLLVKDPLYWSEEAPGTRADRSPYRINEGSAGGTPWSVVEATPLYIYKKELVERLKLNVVRVAQNWDGPQAHALSGLLKALNWKEGESFVADEQAPNSKSSVVKVAPQTLIKLASYAKTRLGATSVRVLGDRDAKVSMVAVHPAYITVKAATRLGMEPNLDAVLSSEGCEWESVEYFEDWIDGGHGKGLIMLGLAVTSDTAAKEFAVWLQSVLGATKVEFLPAGDPFTPVHAGAVRV
jgi:hypothetical protein